MKKIFIKFTVMSVALVLFCVSAVAQNEKNTKNATYSYPRLQVSENPIELAQGHSWSVFITPDAGYYLPKIIYKGTTYEIGSEIDGDIFTIQYSSSSSNNIYNFIITAKRGELEKWEDHIDIDVEMDLRDLRSLNGNTTRSTPLRVNITVFPDANNN